MEVPQPDDAAAQRELHPARKCPRCNSMNTKFCYYNNYTQTQPRYFCKSCRRYWTHGGSLRNIPVGGSMRRFKRPRIEEDEATVPNQLIVPSSSLMQPSPSYYFPSLGGFAGSGFYSSLVALQTMNQAPYNFGNVLQGLDYGTGVFEHKPNCVTNSSSGEGEGPQVVVGDDADLKPDLSFGGGGGVGVGGSRDN